MYTDVHTHTYINICEHTGRSMQTDAYVYMQCMYICMICMYKETCVYMFIYICTFM